MSSIEVPKQAVWLNPVAAMNDTVAPGVALRTDVGNLPFAPAMLAAIADSNKWVAIPDEIVSYYAKWRPTPFRRATNWELAIKSKAPVFIKDEGASLLGSYKLNTALAHAWYAKHDGLLGTVGETLAGHWGLSLAFASQLLGLSCTVVLHETLLQEKKTYLRLIEELGGEVVVCHEPGAPLATSRALAIELARNRGWAYSVGCSYDHVVAHQSVIGLETLSQSQALALDPGALVSCCGSGSNLGGLCVPMLHLRTNRTESLRVLGAVVHRDDRPDSISAKGLTGHHLSRIIQHYAADGTVELLPVKRAEAAAASREFFKCEGLWLAPESGYALALTKKLVTGELNCKFARPVVVCLTGRGYFD